MTRLCVSIYVIDLLQARRDIALAAERGADMVELRIDTFTDETQVKELVRSSTLPSIVTLRAEFEGGKCELDDTQRLALLTTAAEAGASYLDIELATVNANHWAGPAKPRDQRAGWIYSSHDFSSRPANLSNIVKEMTASSCDINKVAWQARSIRDNIEAFELMLDRHKPTIAICMSEAGMISRILARKFGAFLSFASLDQASATAPGQVAANDLKNLYRWDKQNSETKVFGVVGQPIAHSMSPAIHNRAFDQIDFNGVYVPFLVEGSFESFKAFMEMYLDFQPLMLGGLSITIPHKENALRYLKEKGSKIETLSERIGAVNTIVIHRDAGTCHLEGFNTDYAAILDCVCEGLSIQRNDLKDKKIALLGAGGTGRTTVAALAHYGANVTIYNRTVDRAQALADEFNGKSGQVSASPIEKLSGLKFDAIINTTSLGMHPNITVSPIDESMPTLDPGTLVFDTIYNPLDTKLLKIAREKQAKTVAGIEMFVRQAAGQFQAWTGQAAPTEVMRQVVIERLRK